MLLLADNLTSRLHFRRSFQVRDDSNSHYYTIQRFQCNPFTHRGRWVCDSISWHVHVPVAGEIPPGRKHVLASSTATQQSPVAGWEIAAPHSRGENERTAPTTWSRTRQLCPARARRSPPAGHGRFRSNTSIFLSLFPVNPSRFGRYPCRIERSRAPPLSEPTAQFAEFLAF